MTIYLNPGFWLDLLQRVLRSAAQGALLVWGVTDLTSAVTVPATPQLLGAGAYGGALLAALTGIAFPAYTPTAAATARRAITEDTTNA